jgi:hypothetical protein
MARASRWNSKDIKNGFWEIELSSWKYFHDYIRQEMLDYSHYVWRGQRDSKWRLESSLDRILKRKPRMNREKLAKEHLENFKYSVRGRRGENPQLFDNDNAWWSLGQHFGLATPLLDWTESPFVALYFAMENSIKTTSGKRAVWALGSFERKNEEIKRDWDSDERPPIIERIKPLQDENYRLVSQSGLFTRSPLGIPIDAWVDEKYKDFNKGILIKFTIPEEDRRDCLRTLNRMNINHLTLFPDLYGSSEFCNKRLDINKY